MIFASILIRRASNSFIGFRVRSLRYSTVPCQYASGGTTSTSWKGVASAIQDEVDGGTLLYDPLQQQAAKKLDRVQNTLVSYEHTLYKQQLQRVEDHHEKLQLQEGQQQDDINQKNKELNINDEPPSISIQVPRGFYIHGSVGTGKSMMLSVFYEHAPTHKKRR